MVPKYWVDARTRVKIWAGLFSVCGTEPFEMKDDWWGGCRVRWDTRLAEGV